ncbi:probable RNA-binding protein ARP1 isoform X2 [Phragmites australis]|uniref:probable RNA-binding protein ARP1 isoform X2 n=1 Tax=Phragmites australis TaxID=29695 RepID=UPI002D78E9FE|nr:probable RNA-binding protein ARP1 isoform X2 [Phragmites australis]
MAAPSSSSSAGRSPAHAPAVGGGGAHHHRSRFGDTTLTKVFVGGLAWETPSEGLHDHFRGYGEILEAVVITDRETGRSKGYGFVIFRDPEAAQRAVQNPNPVIAGRRANCNIASMGPPRPAPPRGRGGAGRGPHLPDQPPMGPPYRVPSQMTPPHAAPVYYHPQYGYWYPHDYPYQQQALYNSQVLQHYYPQLYGPTSPSGPTYPYMGYIPGGPGPRSGFSPMQQPTRPPFFQQQPAQVEGSFPPAPSLPPNFRLQLPPHAVSRQSDDASGAQSTQPTSSTAATSTNNQEASRPVRSNSDPNSSN